MATCGRLLGFWGWGCNTLRPMPASACEYQSGCLLLRLMHTGCCEVTPLGMPALIVTWSSRTYPSMYCMYMALCHTINTLCAWSIWCPTDDLLLSASSTLPTDQPRARVTCGAEPLTAGVFDPQAAQAYALVLYLHTFGQPPCVSVRAATWCLSRTII